MQNGGEPINERVARVETRLLTVEDGVKNFRAFHTEVRNFIVREDTRQDDRATQDKSRARIHYWWLALLSALIAGGFAAVLTWALNFEDRHHIISDTPSSYIRNQNSEAPQ